MKWEFAVVEPWMWPDDSTWVNEGWEESERMVLVYGRATDTPTGRPYEDVVAISWHWIKDDVARAVEKMQVMLEGSYINAERVFRPAKTARLLQP